MTSAPLRFGIIGAGMIAEFHAQAIAAMAEAELVAVCARRMDAAEAFATSHGVQAYDDIDAFLGHQPLDVVTICTPSGAHLEPTLAAAAAGKHVICEKPLEVTTERVDAMIAACEKRPVSCSPAFFRAGSTVRANC